MPFYKKDGLRLSNGMAVKKSGVGQKCLVCGEPNSNCKTGDSLHPKIAFASAAKPEQDMVYVDKDHFTKVQIAPGTFTNVRLAKAGTYISRREAAEIGLLVDDGT